MLAAARSLSYQAIKKDAPAEDIHTSYPFAVSLKEVTSLDKKVVFNSTTDGKVLVPMHPPRGALRVDRISPFGTGWVGACVDHEGPCRLCRRLSPRLAAVGRQRSLRQTLPRCHGSR